jgi:hypothetical protein
MAGDARRAIEASWAGEHPSAAPPPRPSPLETGGYAWSVTLAHVRMATASGPSERRLRVETT